MNSMLGFILLQTANLVSGQIIFTDDTNGNKCGHVFGNNVKCIPVRECPNYSLEKFRDTQIVRRLGYSDFNHLKHISCGFFGSNPLVCCDIADVGYPSRTGDSSSPYTTTPSTTTTTTTTTSVPSPQQCLKYGYRIVGGEEAELHEYPWMALLLYLKNNFKIEFGCGGALLNHRYVLTAAHCVKTQDRTSKLIAVRLGEWKRDTDVDCELDKCADPVKDVIIEEEILHELYLDLTGSNDIALLRLATEVQFTKSVKPLCLPPDDFINKYNLTNMEMEIMGWGQWGDSSYSNTSNVLQKGIVQGVDSEACGKIYNIKIDNTKLCAGGQNSNPCKGDSGGPLVYQHTSNLLVYYIAVGIISQGPKKCGTNGMPAVYTRITSYIQWIKSKIS